MIMKRRSMREVCKNPKKSFALGRLLTAGSGVGASLRRLGKKILRMGLEREMPLWRDEEPSEQADLRWAAAAPLKNEDPQAWLLRFSAILADSLSEGLDDPASAFKFPARGFLAEAVLSPLSALVARFYGTGRVFLRTWTSRETLSEAQRLREIWLQYSAFDLASRAQRRRQWAASCARPLAPSVSGCGIRQFFGGISGAILGAAFDLIFALPRSLVNWGVASWRCANWDRRSRSAMIEDRREALAGVRSIPVMIGKKPQAWAAAWEISTRAKGQNNKIVGYDCGPELGFVTLGREISSSIALCAIGVSWLAPKHRPGAAACLFVGSTLLRNEKWSRLQDSGLDSFFHESFISVGGLSSAALDPSAVFAAFWPPSAPLGGAVREALGSMLAQPLENAISVNMKLVTIESLASLLWPGQRSVQNFIEHSHISWGIAACKLLSEDLPEGERQRKIAMIFLMRSPLWTPSMAADLRSAFGLPNASVEQLLTTWRNVEPWRAKLDLLRLMAAEEEGERLRSALGIVASVEPSPAETVQPRRASLRL